jgi:hypothetical protein
MSATGVPARGGITLHHKERQGHGGPREEAVQVRERVCPFRHCEPLLRTRRMQTACGSDLESGSLWFNARPRGAGSTASKISARRSRARNEQRPGTSGGSRKLEGEAVEPLLYSGDSRESWLPQSLPPRRRGNPSAGRSYNDFGLRGSCHLAWYCRWRSAEGWT